LKTLTTDAANALAARRAVISGALKLALPTPRYFWAGIGDLVIDGDTYKGIGARAIISPVSSSLGGAASGITLVLGGLTPEVAASIEDEDYSQKPVILRRLIFDGNGVDLIQSYVVLRGKLDEVTIRQTTTGEAAIDFQIENSARDFSRANASIRSDAHQRILGGATDGGLKHISVAGITTLYWGKRPTNSPLAPGGVGSNNGNGAGSGRWYRGREW
jgi:hypothetical protein